MNKGRNVAILLGCLLVLSLLTLLTRTFGDNRTGVVDYVRYVRDPDPDRPGTIYEFYFVGTEVMEGALEQLDDGRRRITVDVRVPKAVPEQESRETGDKGDEYTLEPYGYTYYVSGEDKASAEVTWEYAEGFDGSFAEEPFGRFTPDVFLTMIFGKKPLITVLQAVIVAAIAAGGALIIFYAEELWHFFNRKGEEEIPQWHDMDVYKRTGGAVIGVAVALLIVFIII